MKRVLLLMKGLGRGGAEQIVVNASRYVDREEFAYEVAYLLPWKDALVGELEEAGMPVRCLDGGRGAAWTTRLRSLVRDRRIDLIHAHQPFAAIGARVAFGRRRPRMVTTEHNMWERYHRATYWGNVATFPRNDHVFAVSAEVAKSIRYPIAMRFLPMPTVETLHHGLDLEAVAGWAEPNGIRAELGIDRDAPVVGMVANFKAHKGHDQLLKAALQVRREVPGVRFVLVGTGPTEEVVRREAHALGLDETVVFAGFRSDAQRVAATFDVFTLSSIHEGLSIALIEAMALGKATVITDAGGMTEVVEDGREGLVVPPRDPGALAGALVRVLKDAELRERLAGAGRRRAQDFDIRVAVRRIEEVYRGLLK